MNLNLYRLKRVMFMCFYIANKSLSEIFSVNFDGETFTGIKLKSTFKQRQSF
ncbi:MAG: hypothetical protein L6V93_08145 [Clostridiales bacterium]|nr:MAG: hypothetical protein L6V93_08145 [Clostridiales bacterium]